MKKFLICLLFSILTAGCATKVEEQKFVNPIFYQVMDPISIRSWKTQITPNQMIRSNKGDILEQKCTLVENTMDAVTLRCEGAYKKENITLYSFVLDPEDKNYRGLVVNMRYREPHEPEDFFSEVSFVIY